MMSSRSDDPRAVLDVGVRRRWWSRRKCSVCDLVQRREAVLVRSGSWWSDAAGTTSAGWRLLRETDLAREGIGERDRTGGVVPRRTIVDGPRRFPAQRTASMTVVSA